MRADFKRGTRKFMRQICSCGFFHSPSGKLVPSSSRNTVIWREEPRVLLAQIADEVPQTSLDLTSCSAILFRFKICEGSYHKFNSEKQESYVKTSPRPFPREAKEMRAG